MVYKFYFSIKSSRCSQILCLNSIHEKFQISYTFALIFIFCHQVVVRKMWSCLFTTLSIVSPLVSANHQLQSSSQISRSESQPNTKAQPISLYNEPATTERERQDNQIYSALLHEFVNNYNEYTTRKVKPTSLTTETVLLSSDSQITTSEVKTTVGIQQSSVSPTVSVGASNTSLSSEDLSELFYSYIDKITATNIQTDTLLVRNSVNFATVSKFYVRGSISNSAFFRNSADRVVTIDPTRRFDGGQPFTDSGSTFTEGQLNNGFEPTLAEDQFLNGFGSTLIGYSSPVIIRHPHSQIDFHGNEIDTFGIHSNTLYPERHHFKVLHN